MLKVDNEKHPELAARFNVRSIPNFAALYGGRIVMQQPGLVGHDQMEHWLKSAEHELTHVRSEGRSTHEPHGSSQNQPALRQGFRRHVAEESRY